MAINDFAGPIIQAFMAGQQMKRQREQDILAQQERERMIKEAERQVKRQEQQDKIDASMRRFQMEDIIRGQMAAGTRNIPVVDMPAPGGVAAPQVSPVAQQLMAPSAVQELPLQQVPGVQAPMQLGQEFAIPETQRVQQNILNIPEIGQFDLRQMPTFEDTMRRRTMERAMLGQAEVAIEGAKAGARAEAEQPFKLGLEETKAKGRVEEAKAKATTATALQAQKFGQAKELEELKARNRAKENEIKQQGRIAGIQLAESLRAKRQGKAATADIEGTLELFRNGTYTIEDMGKVPGVLRQEVADELKKQNIPVLSRAQATGLGQFKVALSFINKMKELATEIDNNPLSSTMPWISERANLEYSIGADIEQYAKSQKGVTGVLTEGDLLRQKGAIPRATPRPNRSGDNWRLIANGEKALKERFLSQYRNLSDTAKAQLAREVGILYLFKDGKK